MAKIIAQRELRNDNAKVIEEVASGQRFIVTRNGNPVAELLPLRDHRPTKVPKSVIESFIGTGSSIDAQRFRADLDNLINPYL